MSYNSTYANPMGRTARGPFVVALVILLLVTGFYYQFVKGQNGEWVLFTLLYPAFVLYARRLHDMGKTAWLLIVPGALVAAAALPPTESRFSFEKPLFLVATAVFALFAIWGALGKSQDGDNKYGAAAA
jgi:uncharacterized membrane protein YhaH (DUF805 family)